MGGTGLGLSAGVQLCAQLARSAEYLSRFVDAHACWQRVGERDKRLGEFLQRKCEKCAEFFRSWKKVVPNSPTMHSQHSRFPDSLVG